MTERNAPDLAALADDYPWRHGTFAGLAWRWRDTGGAGRPLVLLPGALGTADIFIHQLRHFAGRRRCVAVDYPAGAADSLAVGLARLAADGLNAPHVDALGASFGGYWLQFAAARHRERFRRVILANTFADGTGVARHPLFDAAAIRARAPADTKREWAERLDAAPPDALRDLQRLLLAEQPAAILHDRLLAVAIAIPAPATPAGIDFTIFECADDPLIPSKTQADLRRRIPGAAVVRFERGGHYPHVTIASDYNRILDDLLSSNDAVF